MPAQNSYENRDGKSDDDLMFGQRKRFFTLNLTKEKRELRQEVESADDLTACECRLGLHLHGEKLCSSGKSESSVSDTGFSPIAYVNHCQTREKFL